MMEKIFFDTEVENALAVLRKGGIILYPTDTIWGIGCDATDEKAVDKIYQLKKRADTKSMIILVADERSVMQYVAAPDPAVFDFIAEQSRPTTIIFENGIGLPDNLLASDGSVAIRIVKDEFCRHLVKRLRHPIVSTSANISGQPSPAHFRDISPDIINGVDHVVQWRKEDVSVSLPSQIIRWDNDGTRTVIRP